MHSEVPLHLPQHQQDLSYLQGKQRLFDIHETRYQSYFFQPVKFYQLDHEEQFKFNMKGLVIVITVYVASFMISAEFVEPGSFRTSSEKVFFLTTAKLGPEDVVPLGFIFHRVTCGVTILIMLLSELSARIMRLSSTTPVYPLGPNNDFVIENNIPFSSLNLAIFLGVIVVIVRDVVFNSYGARGVPISAVLATLLFSNKKARKHIALQLRQKIDSIYIGGNNTVHPVVEVALVELRDHIEDFPPRHNVPQIYMV